MASEALHEVSPPCLLFYFRLLAGDSGPVTLRSSKISLNSGSLNVLPTLKYSPGAHSSGPRLNAISLNTVTILYGVRHAVASIIFYNNTFISFYFLSGSLQKKELDNKFYESHNHVCLTHYLLYSVWHTVCKIIVT